VSYYPRSAMEPMSGPGPTLTASAYALGGPVLTTQQ
jgi:hypothetical protein